MYKKLTRKERQYEKLEKAARKGRTSISIFLFPQEITWWKKQGFLVDIDVNNVNKNISLISFNHYNYSEQEIKLFIEGQELPANISKGEYLYILSRIANFNKP